MQRSAREQARKYAFDWRDEPLLRVKPGESFVLETYDASTGYFKSAQDKAVPAQRPGFDRFPPLANPIAGPVILEGAQRGDVLVVVIEEILVDDYSWIAVGPRRGPLGESTRWPELSADYTTRIFRHTPGPSGTTRDGTLHFNDKISWPITPFIGTLGVAPDREVTTSLDGQGEWGGNLDIRDVTAGNRILLPIFHEGACFYLGDVHASQGDTEFTGTAAKTGKARYDCFYANRHGIERKCKGIAAACIDQLVSRQVLRALEPASLELSLRAAEDIEKERTRLGELRQQELQRARYEAQRAERHYRSVDPENRLVAGTLEKEWEKALGRQRQLEEDWHRCEQDMPSQLTAAEREQIRALAADLPSLWNAPETTAADRKEITRCLIDKVVVTAQGATEHIDVAIHWKGGFISQHAVVRRVQKYEQLRDFDAIMNCVHAGHAAGLLSAQIAEQLQQAGIPTVNPALPWDKHMVLSLLRRRHLLPGRTEKIDLAADEWLLADLARELGIGCSHLRRWMQRKHVHWRRSPLRGYYVLWADADEQKRLRKLHAFFHAHPSLSAALYPKELTTPKPRKSLEKKAKSPAQG